MKGKKSSKLVLDFYSTDNPPEMNGSYFVVFKIVIEKKHPRYEFGYSEFDKDHGWWVPSDESKVHLWTALPSAKILL